MSMDIEISRISTAEIDRELAMEDSMSKALDMSKMNGLQQSDADAPKSFFIDPTQAWNFVNYLQTSKPVTSRVLRDVAIKDKIIASVIQLRKNQVRNYCKPNPKPGISGYVVQMRDTTKSPTRKDKDRIDEVVYFLQNCGFPAVGADGKPRDKFGSFLNKLIEDSLIFDGASFERTYDRSGRLAEVYAVDGGTIRIWQPYHDGTSLEYKFIQEINGQVMVKFTVDELVYSVRNCSSDLYRFGYGQGEVEKCLELVTRHLFAEQWNTNFFMQGSVPPGMLTVLGNISRQTLEQIKRNWMAQVSGVQNAWRVPILGVADGKGVNWVPFHGSHRDMEFYQWIRYLIACICAVFQVTPEEIGFESFKGGASGGGSTFESRNEQRIIHSQDKGLYPLMLWLEELISTEIVQKIYPDLTFSWVGLREKTEQERVDLAEKELRNYKTLNEVRAENDLPKIKGAWADLPLNPAIPQLMMTAQSMEQGQGEGDQAQDQEQDQGQNQGYGGYDEMGNNGGGVDGEANQENDGQMNDDDEYYKQLLGRLNVIGKKAEKSFLATLEKDLAEIFN